VTRYNIKSLAVFENRKKKLLLLYVTDDEMIIVRQQWPSHYRRS